MRTIARNVCLLLGMLALGLFAGHGMQRLRAHHDRLDALPREGDYSALIAKGEAPVVLFATSTCPYCKMAREFLSQHRIPFREIDVLSEDGRVLFKQHGGKGVPLLMTADIRMQGFLEPEYRKYLMPLAIQAYAR